MARRGNTGAGAGAAQGTGTRAAGTGAGGARGRKVPRRGKTNTNEVRTFLAVFCGFRFILPGVCIMITGIIVTVLSYMAITVFDTDDHRIAGPVFIAIGVLFIALSITYMCVITGCRKKKKIMPDPDPNRGVFIANDGRQMQPLPPPNNSPPSYGESTSAGESSRGRQPNGSDEPVPEAAGYHPPPQGGNALPSKMPPPV